MKKGIVQSVCVAVASLLCEGIAHSEQVYLSTVTQIQPPNSSVDCLWFQLNGVAQADPINPNSPWFAIPRTQNGYNELYALLLAAKLGGLTLQLATTGAAAGGNCGRYAGVASITAQ